MIALSVDAFSLFLCELFLCEQERDKQEIYYRYDKLCRNIAYFYMCFCNDSTLVTPRNGHTSTVVSYMHMAPKQKRLIWKHRAQYI